jgi:hypothetical protein
VFKLLCYVYIGNMIFVTTFKIDYFLFVLPCLQLYILEFVLHLEEIIKSQSFGNHNFKILNFKIFAFAPFQYS